MPAPDSIAPAAVHALLDILEAAELAWQLDKTPHIRTLRRMNTPATPQPTRDLLSRLVAEGAAKCRDFCGKAIDNLNQPAL